MEQIYKFADWTSAARMKNAINPCLAVDIGIIRDGENFEDIAGYQLTVVDTAVNRIVYKYYIDYAKEGTWSLTTHEAILMLNMIGFPCIYDTSSYDIEKIRTTLESLLNLGYTQVSRSIRPAKIYAYNPDVSQVTDLGEITEYDYHDYLFLDEVPTSIEGILERG